MQAVKTSVDRANLLAAASAQLCEMDMRPWMEQAEAELACTAT